MDPTDFPAKGRIIDVRDGLVVLHPAGTNYELLLATPKGSADKFTRGELAEGIIRVTMRKLWTIPSGGNYITPIFGPPRIVQGRVRAASESTIVVHAGTNITVDLAKDSTSYDLSRGPVTVGCLVNVTAFPGATFELLPVATAN